MFEEQEEKARDKRQVSQKDLIMQNSLIEIKNTTAESSFRVQPSLERQNYDGQVATTSKKGILIAIIVGVAILAGIAVTLSLILTQNSSN